MGMSAMNTDSEGRGDLGKKLLGFEDAGEYLHTGYYNKTDGAATYPKLVQRRTFKTKTLEEMSAEAHRDQPTLPRKLGWFQLWNMGVGFMCGAGIFVSPGYIAHSLTGPALFLAYGIAAISAFLSSFCYAEFTVRCPMAGAAYNYIYSTLGEAISWITVSNLILEYILANAAAVRGFAPYLALLVNKPTGFFIKQWHGYKIDGWACGVTIFVTAILAYGIQESATTNTILTMIHITVMLFIIIAGLTKAKAANFKPFIREGSTWKDIFNGAAVSFFSFIGFDALATTAEEIKDPARDMPIGILGAVSTVTVIYMTMCVTLNLMVPTPDISEDGTFAAAFQYVGYDWAKYIVAIGALIGIFTTTLIGVMGCARILVGACRERMLPPFLATIGKRRRTPWVATWTVGIVSALIALFTDFAKLANMISIGTFLVFWVVALALLWHRCHVPGKTTRKNLVLLLVHTFALIGFALGFTLAWTLPDFADSIDGYTDDYGEYVAEVPAGKSNSDQWIYLLVLGLCYILTTLSFTLTVKQDYIPPLYKVPAFPLIPCASIFVNTFLLGQLDKASYKRFGWWSLAAVAIYLLYGMIAQQAYDNRGVLPSAEPSVTTSNASKEAEAAAAAAKLGSSMGSPHSSPLSPNSLASPDAIHAPTYRA